MKVIVAGGSGLFVAELDDRSLIPGDDARIAPTVSRTGSTSPRSRTRTKEAKLKGSA
jgi:hypothetical protein